MRAPRRRAWSRSSSTSAPAASAATKPSRRASKGRDIPSARQRRHVGEGAEPDRGDGRLGPAADDDVAAPGRDQPGRGGRRRGCPPRRPW